MNKNDKKPIGKLIKVLKTSAKCLLILLICYSCDAGSQQKQNQSQNRNQSQNQDGHNGKRR